METISRNFAITYDFYTIFSNILVSQRLGKFFNTAARARWPKLHDTNEQFSTVVNVRVRFGTKPAIPIGCKIPRVQRRGTPGELHANFHIVKRNGLARPWRWRSTPRGQTGETIGSRSLYGRRTAAFARKIVQKVANLQLTVAVYSQRERESECERERERERQRETESDYI